MNEHQPAPPPVVVGPGQRNHTLGDGCVPSHTPADLGDEVIPAIGSSTHARVGNFPTLNDGFCPTDTSPARRCNG